MILPVSGSSARIIRIQITRNIVCWSLYQRSRQYRPRPVNQKYHMSVPDSGFSDIRYYWLSGCGWYWPEPHRGVMRLRQSPGATAALRNLFVQAGVSANIVRIQLTRNIVCRSQIQGSLTYAIIGYVDADGAGRDP